MGVAEKRGEYFPVTVTRKEAVAAALPLQDHWLPLSNLDLLLPPLDVSVFFCYAAPIASGSCCAVNVLKKAMAEVLVSYYAFAGEVETSPSGEPELLCNNRGVDFLEAHADVELSELDLHKPDESIARFVPNKKQGVLAVQVTELRCGSLVVACTFDHRIADAYSANMFLVSWAETSRSRPVSLVPSFRRSLLNPRRPIHVDPSLDGLYVPASELPPPKENTDRDPLTSRIYYIEAETLSELQNSARFNGRRWTKLESFSALLWKLVAKHARKNSAGKVSRLGIVVDGRTRLSQGESDREKSLMAAYFGNVLSVPYGQRRLNDLVDRPLSWVAQEVHNFLEDSLTKDHFLSLIDWVEATRPQPAVARIYGGGTDDGPAFVVSSGRGFPVAEMDFGWGAPAFGSYHFPWGGSAGYVMPMPSPTADGGWVVYMHLTAGQLDFIEQEAQDTFRPLRSCRRFAAN